MQIGMIGLGKMGGNMAERLRRAGHDVVGYDRDPKASDVASLAELKERLAAPRAVWVMVPAGEPTRQTINELNDLLDRKSTRLNSSHQITSYAVFCLKKKKIV